MPYYVTRLATAFAMMLFCAQAHAACTGPAANAGQMRYDAGMKKLLVCNNANRWVAAGGGNICCGWTNTGGSGWSTYVWYLETAQITVDTSSCNFTGTPVYMVSLSTSGRKLTGATSLYSESATSFHIYLNADTVVGLNGSYADAQNLHIQWCGIGGKSANSSTGSYY